MESYVGYFHCNLHSNTIQIHAQGKDYTGTFSTKLFKTAVIVAISAWEKYNLPMFSEERNLIEYGVYSF